MKNEDIKVGVRVYVDHLRPECTFSCDKRQEGLEGIVVEGHGDGVWRIRHNHGSFGVYYYDELELEIMFYWYQVRKMYGYI